MKKTKLFSPDNCPRILSVDCLFKITLFMAVDDPDFPDIDRSAEEFDNHSLENQIFQVEPY